MEELIVCLETKIKEIINQYHHIKQSQINLSNTQSLLMKEKEILTYKQQQAISKIEHLVSKLKMIEKSI